MKIFIILTILVSGLSVWGSGVMSVNNEIPEVAAALNFTPTLSNRSIASTTTAPSCPEGDRNCSSIVGDTEASIVSGGHRGGDTAVTRINVTDERTSIKDNSVKPTNLPRGRNNNDNSDDGVSVKRGN